MKKEANISLIGVLWVVIIVGVLSSVILITKQEVFKLQNALITCEQNNE